MARVSHKDLRQLFEGLVQLYELRDRDEFAQFLLPIVRDLSGAEFTTCFEADLSSGNVRTYKTTAYPSFFFTDDHSHMANTFVHECPTTQYYLREKRLPPLFYSDFYTPTDWRKTNLYNLSYGPAAQVVDQVAFDLDNHPTFPVAICGLRSKGQRNYTERERQLLALLRPHAKQAFANAKLLTQLRQELSGLHVATDHQNRGVVGINSKGVIQWTTPKGRRLLIRYFGNTIQADDHLPELVARWVRQEDALLHDPSCVPALPSPLTIQNRKGTLTLRLIREGEARLLFLEEETDRFPVEHLQALGLTKRESEIMKWVGYGKTNGEVATILGNKPRTIEKHLERIYVKLGVENRHAAAIRITELLSLHHGNGIGS